MSVLREIPGRKSLLGIDAILEMQRKGPIAFYLDMWHTYGDIAKLEVGSKTILTIFHPDRVRYVLGNSANYIKGKSYNPSRELFEGFLRTSVGDEWNRQRRILSPFFSLQGVKKVGDRIISTVTQAIPQWEQYADSGEPIEILDQMVAIGGIFILQLLFSIEPHDSLVSLRQHLDKMSAVAMKRMLVPWQLPLWMPLASHRDAKQSMNLAVECLDDLIAQRRAIPQTDWPKDILTHLLLSEYENGKPMSDELIRGQIMGIFLGGYETVAKTLVLIWYLLAKHPHVAQKIQQEAAAVIGNKRPELDDFKQMTYTLQVVKEGMRIYPALPLYTRDVVADDVIDGYAIPAGSVVTLSPYVTHRHPDFWPNPEKFDPDRWQPTRERHVGEYFPFGLGRRTCLGNYLALLEAQIIIGMLSQRFSVHLVEGHVPELVMEGSLTSRNGMPMTIERV
ncbi:MAG: cytochrome P450 [Cyanobacteria bacterium P01_E01_bin.42]